MKIQSRPIKEPIFFYMDRAYPKGAPSTDFAFTDCCSKLYADSAHRCRQPINVKLYGIGRNWPDFLNPTNSDSPLLCSQRVFDSIKTAKLTGCRALKVKLHPPNDKTINQPWDYYWIFPVAPAYEIHRKVTSGIEIPHLYQFLTYWNSSESVCESAKSICDNPESYDTLKRSPDIATWDGSDFNRFGKVLFTGPMGGIPCSRRVVDLAAQEKWTNESFSIVDALDRPLLDHMNGPWPPATWYNPYEPV